MFPTTCLEAGDRLEMKFDSVIANFISQVEGAMQFIRDTALVTVVQGIIIITDTSIWHYSPNKCNGSNSRMPQYYIKGMSPSTASKDMLCMNPQ